MAKDALGARRGRNGRSTSAETGRLSRIVCPARKSTTTSRARAISRRRATDPRCCGSSSIRSNNSSPRYRAAWAVSGFFVDQRIARLISLPTWPNCSASDRLCQRPRAASGVATRSSTHHTGNERGDRGSRGRIIDAPRPVAKGRPEIDHGIEFQPVLSRDVRVEINPPEVRLLRPVGQQAAS